MIEEIQKLLEQYRNWLRDKTQLRQLDDWVEITTPFLDRHNDFIQIYAQKHNGGYLLTDDGYTLEDLEQNGCKLQSPKRQELLKMTLNGFGIQMVGDRLQVSASPDNFALRKHNLMQAILAVNDMFFLASPMVKSLFYEDVVEWLELHDIRYTPKVKFAGKSGYDHLFDFVIPKSRRKPERILQTINQPSKDTALSLVQAWNDTREVRAPESRAFALLNDTEQVVSAGVIYALKSYDVYPVPWSLREEVREELAA
jgi:hypothetical protein